jgi:hypothetical protein
VSNPLHLTMGRLTALVIGVPISLAVIGWGTLTAVALVSADSFQIHRSFSPSGSQLSVAVDSGNLTLVPSTDGQVHLTGIAHYALVRPTVNIETTGAGVAVTVPCPWFVTNECSVDLTVAVPSGIAVTASTDAGDVTASSISNLSLKTDSGNLQVTGGSGIVHLTTDSGQITGAAMGAANVTANADSGDVTLNFAQVPANVSVQDDSGNVVVTLPPGGTSYAVSAHSLSGNTTIGVPTNPASTDVISISVDSGNVSVNPGA